MYDFTKFAKDADPDSPPTRSEYQWLEKQRAELRELRRKKGTVDFGEADQHRMEELEHRLKSYGG